jgi:hypothetical protein
MPDLSMLLMVMHESASNLGVDISSPLLIFLHPGYWWQWRHQRCVLLIGITIGFYILRFLQSSTRPIHLPLHMGAHSCLLDGVHSQCPCLDIL